MGTPTKAKTTKGLKVKRGDGGSPSETFTLIGEVKSLDGPNEEAPDIDVSNFDSLAEEFIAGLPTNGEVALTLNFIGSDTQQQALRADLRAGTLRNFKIEFPDHVSSPTTVSFSAIVKMFGVSGQTKGALEAKVNLKISGQPSWTYAPS